MVESKSKNGTSSKSLDQLSQAMSEALASGVTTEEILAMLKTPALDTEAERPENGAHLANPDPIYTEVPDGGIDLPSAARKYGIHRGTLHTWVNTDRIGVIGRLKAPAAGGGYLIVNESELIEYIAAPRNKGGRPRKT